MSNGGCEVYHDENAGLLAVLPSLLTGLVAAQDPLQRLMDRIDIRESQSVIETRVRQDESSKEIRVRQDELSKEMPVRQDELSKNTQVRQDESSNEMPIHEDRSMDREIRVHQDDTEIKVHQYKLDLEMRVRQDELSKEMPVRQDELSKNTQVRQDELSKETRVRQDELSKKMRVRQDELSKNTQVRQDELSKETRVRQDELSKNTQVRQDELSKNTQVRQDELSKEMPVRQDELSKNTQVRQDESSNEMPIHEDRSMDREIRVRQDDTEIKVHQYKLDLEMRVRQDELSKEMPIHENNSDPEMRVRQEELEIPVYQNKSDLETHQTNRDSESPAYKNNLDPEMPVHQNYLDLETAAHQNKLDLEMPLLENKSMDPGVPVREDDMELETSVREAKSLIDHPLHQDKQDVNESPQDDFGVWLKTVRLQLCQIRRSDSAALKRHLTLDPDRSLMLGLLYGSTFYDAVEILESRSIEVTVLSESKHNAADAAERFLHSIIHNGPSEAVPDYGCLLRVASRAKSLRSDTLSLSRSDVRGNDALQDMIRGPLTMSGVRTYLSRLGFGVNQKGDITSRDGDTSRLAAYHKGDDDKSPPAKRPKKNERVHHVVDVNAWYCSCDDYQRCYTSHSPSHIMQSGEILDRIPPSQETKLLRNIFAHSFPVKHLRNLPLCAHLLSVAMLLFNLAACPNYDVRLSDNVFDMAPPL